MIIKEIQAKTLLASITHPDPWFGMKYNLNLYRGCQHQCIYCDSRSECYQIENFDGEILVKVNALELLPKELRSKRTKGVVGFGSMNDPYMPIEAEYNLTGRALALIAEMGFGAHITTKSDLILRDLPILERINRVHASACLTITTADDALSRILEPGAPPSSARYEAVRRLRERGIHAGLAMMPILPFIEDNEENIVAIVRKAKEANAEFILPGLGMTMRDRQRAYYYAKLDIHFPGLREQYERRFGKRYGCSANNTKSLEQLFQKLCQELGMATSVTKYTPPTQQLSLF